MIDPQLIPIARYIAEHPGCKKRHILEAFPGVNWQWLKDALPASHLAELCTFPTGWFSPAGPENQGHKWAKSSRDKAMRVLYPERMNAGEANV